MLIFSSENQNNFLKIWKLRYSLVFKIEIQFSITNSNILSYNKTIIISYGPCEKMH
jgi:hypothetical protein